MEEEKHCSHCKYFYCHNTSMYCSHPTKCHKITLFFKTDKGVFVQCGCFFGNLEEFVAKVKETHQGNKHERDYLALVEFIKVRFEL